MKKLIVAIALSSASLTEQAAAQGGIPLWERAIAQDKSFSIETPCTTGVVEQLRQAPADLLKGVSLPPQSRVACATSQLILVAGAVEGRSGKTSMFDLAVSDARADPTAEGSPSLTSINGHRAYLIRQTEGNRVAQSGFVELSPNKIVLLMAGARPETTLTVEDQGAIIDKFYQSLRIGAK